VKRLALLLLALVVVGCEPSVSLKVSTNECVVMKGYVYCQIRFRDGQRCVVGAHAISCDWGAS